MVSQQVFVYEITQGVIAGDDYEVIATITSNGNVFDLTGYTVTCSVYDERDHANSLITGHAVTLTTPAVGLVTVTFLAAESVLLHPHPLSLDTSLPHIADFKCVSGGGAIVHSDPWRVMVRRKATS